MRKFLRIFNRKRRYTPCYLFCTGSKEYSFKVNLVNMLL